MTQSAALVLLFSTALYGATINLSIPAFSGCADQFRCQYSGYSGSFATQPGAEINVDIGSMIFSYTPTPAPDQHDWYNFPYSVNGVQSAGSLYYFAQVGGNAFFDFVFFAVPAGDPYVRFSTALTVGPVDGRTRTPIVLEASDGNEPQGTVSAAIHAPEPGTWTLAVATLIAMQIARSLLGAARATIAVGTANLRQYDASRSDGQATPDRADTAHHSANTRRSGLIRTRGKHGSFTRSSTVDHRI